VALTAHAALFSTYGAGVGEILTLNEEKQGENEFRINTKMSLNRLLNNTIEFINKDENNNLALSGLGNAI